MREKKDCMGQKVGRTDTEKPRILDMRGLSHSWRESNNICIHTTCQRSSWSTFTLHEWVIMGSYPCPKSYWQS